jgi:hypothetical protein
LLFVRPRLRLVRPQFDLEESRFDPVRPSFDLEESRFDSVRRSFDLEESRLHLVRPRSHLLRPRFLFVRPRFHLAYPSSPAADPGILETRAASNDTAAPLPPDAAVVVASAPGVRQIAAEFGITENADDQRVQRFKSKWMPKWKKHRRDQALMVVALVLLLGAALWWMLHGKTEEAIGPTAVPVLAPAPTASVAPPEKFNQADPTQEEQERKPQRLKA